MSKKVKKQVKKDQVTLLIERLEKERKSKVIVYFTGDKQPADQFSAQVASDVLPLFREILESFSDDTNKITLVLNTNGGHLQAPWPLVNLIREYCRSFEVLVLEKALSAGTLITLGADKVIMLPYSQLSPVDPAAEIFDGDKKQKKRLEIEDIIGYIDFAKEKVGIAEQSALSEVLKELAKEISPTMLGSVNRTHSLIRRLAKNMLALHRQKLTEKQIKEITDHLTQKLYSHTHFINRREARDVVGFGSIIEFAKPELKDCADKLFDCYVKLLEIKEDFNPLKILGKENEKDFNLTRAVVHSLDTKYNFKSDYKILKIPDPSGKQQIVINNINNSWALSK